MLGFIVTSLQNTHPSACRVATHGYGLVMNTPSGSLLEDFASEWNSAHGLIATSPLAAPPPAAPLPAAPSPIAASPLAQSVSRILLGVWKPFAAPPPAAPLSPPSPPPGPPVAAPLAAEDLTANERLEVERIKVLSGINDLELLLSREELKSLAQELTADEHELTLDEHELTLDEHELIESLDSLVGPDSQPEFDWVYMPEYCGFVAVHGGPFIGPKEEPYAILDEFERRERMRQETQTCEEEAQAKLRVHLTPRQSDGRISNSLGMDGWANISLAALEQMYDENRLFAESFDPKLEDDFVAWSNARIGVQAQIRRIRARNCQRDEWVRHDPKSARARRYVMLKEAARQVYRARGSALSAVIKCRRTHMHKSDTYDLVEALAEQAVATHALDEALARQTAKIQLIKTFGRG